MKRCRIRCSMKYCFDLTFVRVPLKKIEFTLCKGESGICQVPRRTQEGGSQPTHPRAASYTRKRNVPKPASLETPHVTGAKISTSLTSVTRVLRKFLQLF